MQISNLNDMEDIVNSHPSLKWNGWDVEYVEKDNNAIFKLNGAFVDGSWHTKQVYKNTNGVWDIPDNILRKGNVQI